MYHNIYFHSTMSSPVNFLYNVGFTSVIFIAQKIALRMKLWRYGLYCVSHFQVNQKQVLSD